MDMTQKNKEYRMEMKIQDQQMEEERAERRKMKEEKLFEEEKKETEEKQAETGEFTDEKLIQMLNIKSKVR